MILLDMDMPKNCRDCKLAHDEIYCSVTHRSVLDQSIDFMKERLPDCPIVAYMAKGGVQTQKNNRPT